MPLSQHIRDIKILVHLLYILLEVSTDSWVFVSIDADHAKFIDLGVLRRQRSVGPTNVPFPAYEDQTRSMPPPRQQPL